MKTLPIILLTISWCITTTACFDARKQKLIIGEWKGSEWLVEDNPSSYDPSLVTFTFDDNKKYSFQYSNNIERGEYFYSAKQLYTTPEGGIRMMVRVPYLEEDSMVFIMNRGGTEEKLTLVRKK
jgi:hypothetical protein